jgi:poly(3-hydroxybutyrate) depolymerase
MTPFRMMNMFRFCVLLCLWLGLLGASAVAQKTPPANAFRTLTYYEKDSVKLQLDLFVPKPKPNTGTPAQLKRPLLIYVHGGGFAAGDRSESHRLGQLLAGEDVVVATIDYTLLPPGKSFGCNGQLADKVRAIQVAASQTWLATAFFLRQTEAMGIDSTQIFLAGASAGAETVLHAAFWDRSIMSLYGRRLPPTFRYAGVISGAGAIMDLNLIRVDNQIPVMLFHGTDDPLVPYGTASHHFCPPNASGWLMLFGAKSIYEHLVRLNGHSHLLTYCGAGHDIAGRHFGGDYQPVLAFIREVIAGTKTRYHRIIPSVTGRICE